MKKLKVYRVTCWSPLYQTVKAKSKKEAIEESMYGHKWEGPIGEGFEKFDVEEIEE